MTDLIEREQRVTGRRDGWTGGDPRVVRVQEDAHTRGGCITNADDGAAVPGEKPLSATSQRSLAQKVDHLFKTVRPGSREFSIAHVSRATQAAGGPGMSVATVWALRAGTRDNPTMRNLQAMAEFFGVPAQYFFDDAVSERVDEQLALATALWDERVLAVAKRAESLTPASLDVVAHMLDLFRRLEGLSEVEPLAAAPDGELRGHVM